ncbi:hypothetical protein NOF04DRAFT_1194936, partial [Fusarium oxysporum II5]
ERFSAKLAFISSKSTRGHLSIVTAFYLLLYNKAEIREFKLKGGLILLFRCYNLGFIPL